MTKKITYYHFYSNKWICLNPSSVFDKLRLTNGKRHTEFYRSVIRKAIIIIFLFVFLNHFGFAQLLHFKTTSQLDNSLSKGFYFQNQTDSTIIAREFHAEIQPYYHLEIKPSEFDLRKELYYNLFDKWHRNKRIDPFPTSWFTSNINADFLERSDLYSDGTLGENNSGINLNYFSLPHMNIDPDSKANNLSISINYNLSLSCFPDYVKSRISKIHVVPGQGYAKSVDWGYRYHSLSFYAAKNAGKYFVFETGFGKHFWGDGHRSLFLSDAAYCYPYFKITTSIWKIKYVNMWTNYKDITGGYDNWFKADNKYGAFHFLSWNATSRLNINFFEAIIWAGKTENHTRGFDINYLNPIIFYRPIEFSLGSPDNAMLGVGGHYKIGAKHVVYSQILLDDFLLKEVRAGFSHMLHPSDTTIQYGSWFNKQAWQLGYKYFDVAGIKYLNFQTEINYVRPYTYSHRMVIENYGHFNEPLAHPLGSNFWESVSFLRYTKNKWLFEMEFLHYVTGLDSNGTHFGQDIFKPTFDTYEPEMGNIVVKQYGNKVAQGIKNTINFIRLKTSYLLYAPLNLRIEAGFIHRTQNSILENKKINYLFFGIKTSLDNRYYDF